MKYRKLINVIGALTLGLLVHSGAYAAGSMPVIVVGVVPMDRDAFQRYHTEYDVRVFPDNVRDFADNAVFEGYLKLGAVVDDYRQSNPRYADLNRFFLDNDNHGLFRAVRDICATTKPAINLLVAFQLQMDPMNILPDKPIRFKIHAFYFADTRSRDDSIYHRSRLVEVRPDDYTAMETKIEAAVFDMINEYLKTQRP